MTKAKIYKVGVESEGNFFDRFFFNKKEALSFMREYGEDDYVTFTEDDRPRTQQEWLNFVNECIYTR
jgi:hypothetical protein